MRISKQAIILLATWLAPVAITLADTTPLDDIEAAERAESARIAMIERVAPAVAAIFDENERGGGTGVIIDANGYGITNFHVVADMLGSGRGLAGLSDGKLYPLEVLGIDPGGDVAMFRLLDRDAFPFARLGDSNAVRVGDTVVALGNPFLLAEDYTPTVTMGIVSGINRYQWGAGQGDTLLYSDCIQTDAAINPGNSGGPLFNLDGEVIGINGRISVSMRGRVNVGLGYAITINQIRMFMPGLRAGLLTTHGTMQAVVRDNFDGGVVFSELMEDGPAWNIGIRPGDRLLRFDDREIRSANAFTSILGTLPGDWPVSVTYQQVDGTAVRAVTRTEAIPVPQMEAYEPRRVLNLDAVEYVIRKFQDATKDNHNWALHGSDDEALQQRVRTRLAEIASPDFDRGAMDKLAHLGADRVVTIDGDTVTTSKPLAGIACPLDNEMNVRLLIDENNGELHRVVVSDRITQTETIFDVENPSTDAAQERRNAPEWASLPANINALAERTVKLVGAKVGRSVGYGSGILVSSDGLMVTVDSALLDGRRARAYLNDGTAYALEPVQSDRDLQLALLKLVPENDTGRKAFPYFDLQQTGEIKRGQWVLAGGNPFKVAGANEPISVARGVLGGLTRLDATRGTQDFPYHGEVLLLDAITSTPGFAGGALVNESGRLVGMVGRMVESRTTHTVLNYAIPANVVRDFVSHATSPDTSTPATTASGKPVYHGIKFFELGYQSNPVYVERVRRGSPAARAGVRRDDLIIGANGMPVPNLEAIERIIAACKPGDTLELTVMRKDVIHKLSIALEEESP
ncbi:MAG: trypsin-like peptidase domain-containing protein [Phycisphaerales bacterium]|nr:trypsin-like peptidase domain-containing protein [Phycisphaerales bacterium]